MSSAPTTDLLPLMKNPVVNVLDRRDAPAAKSYKAHKAAATAEAEHQPISSLFTLVQKSSKGYWVSEWSVVKDDGKRQAHRRRVAEGKDLETAMKAMLSHPSTSVAHAFYKEDGLIGTLRRWFSTPKA